MAISEAQFLEMQARVSKAPATIRRGPPVDLESELHDSIISHCNSRGWLYIHSRMDKRTTQQPGVPDFIILAPDKKTLLIEAKARQEKPRKEQLIFAAWARRQGHAVHLVRNMEEFRAAAQAEGL